jgi:hypothetical protein
LTFSIVRLRPYGIKPRNIWIGNQQAKGFFREDLMEVFRRYIPKSELQTLVADQTPTDLPPEPNATTQAQMGQLAPS